MLLRLILGEKVTFSHCVPTILQMIVTAPAVQGMDLGGWKVVIGGARPDQGVSPGYYKDPERMEELWAGGWLHTGDVANVDEYGYVQIVDRMKDIIKSGGEWIVSPTPALSVL